MLNLFCSEEFRAYHLQVKQSGLQPFFPLDAVSAARISHRVVELAGKQTEIHGDGVNSTTAFAAVDKKQLW